MAQLEVKNLTVRYGAVEALKDASFHLDEGEIVAMIGPNGAGKSTAVKAISGMIDYYGGRMVGGKVTYSDNDITGISTDKLASIGITVVPEGRRVFPNMSVRENLETGSYLGHGADELRQSLDSTMSLFPHLEKMLKRQAGTLSGGEQQMLALGRAMMIQPKLLMLDEPSLGLSPNYVEAIFERIQEINRLGTTILLVEQNVVKALETAHRAYVFDIGKIEREDSAENLLKGFDLKKTFFGG